MVNITADYLCEYLIGKMEENANTIQVGGHVVVNLMCQTSSWPQIGKQILIPYNYTADTVLFHCNCAMNSIMDLLQVMNWGTITAIECKLIYIENLMIYDLSNSPILDYIVF